MLVIVGWVIVTASVLGGYVALGGKLAVLYQPFEVVIIIGSAIGAFITSNPKAVLAKSGKAFGQALKGPQYKKNDYLELLSLLYVVFKFAKTKGMLELEQHVENPENSTIFQQFPGFMNNHHAVTFICDYLRLITLGTENAYELEALMDTELDTHHAEDNQIQGAFQATADALPALGIVAAVLGVIKTMGSISEPPEVLGKLIGGALVGTFLGVMVAYGFVGPLASTLKGTQEAESKYLGCIKAGLLAYLQGYAPAVAVEFARKALLTSVRPTFLEVEQAVESVPPAA